MESRVTLITGASAGIGRSTALAFAARGDRVVVSDVDAGGGEETVALIRGRGGEAVFVPADVSQPEEVEALVTRTMAMFGRLDYAFNNAGIEGEIASTADCSLENWDRVLSVNLRGAWLCMKYEIPAMLRTGGGSIVNCASVAGLVGFRGSPAYAASKHGMVGLTRTAALEYAAQGVRVNAVCPGVIHTAMIDRVTGESADAEAQLVALEPMGRMGRPEEIADSVIWLCSDRASFVTGQAIAVDGGLVAQ